MPTREAVARNAALSADETVDEDALTRTIITLASEYGRYGYEIHPDLQVWCAALSKFHYLCYWHVLGICPRAVEGKFFSADPRPDLAGYSYVRNACVNRFGLGRENDLYDHWQKEIDRKTIQRI